MISQSSTLSIENTSPFDNICDAIVTATKAITTITPADLPKIWESICNGLKNLGQSMLNMIKDFFFKDLPGLILDIGSIAVSLIKRNLDNVLMRAKSALNHLMKILEVLSLIPVCSLICSILLACIYLCQQDWVNAVCALL